MVRLTWNEMPRFKRALDVGAAGIMIPYVQTKEEAEYAAASMVYSPAGLRGVASSPGLPSTASISRITMPRPMTTC